MESCNHVRNMQVCQRQTLLNPRNWSCNECGTTDSVWACLTCSMFACGRTSQGHSLKHFESTKHPLAIEVNQKYVHCYLCNEWVLNDTCNNDIKLIQSLLDQVARQNYQESHTRSGRVIRPAMTFMRMESRVEEAQSRSADKLYTAQIHWKRSVLAKVFTCWKKFIKDSKALTSSTVGGVSTVTTSSSSMSDDSKKSMSRSTNTRKRRVITPGETGLRNLGNTCYMNAALQALGHLHLLRETFRHMADTSQSLFDRQTTIECFQHISSKPVAPPPKPPRLKRRQTSFVSSGDDMVVGVANGNLPSLCEEVHGLMRVMWSGKWAVVTPHTVLTSIWHHLPTFRGYCQQDAHEFLCELLSKLQFELDQYPSELSITITTPTRDVVMLKELLPDLFQGTLANKITYSDCRHSVIRSELFWDLSLEFPSRYHTSLSAVTSGRTSSQSPSCHLIEMLNLFTEEEVINDRVFTCDRCSHHKQSLKKQLLVQTPPEVLRVHLKRFRCLGCKSWQKITSKVMFPMELNLEPYFLTLDNNVSEEGVVSSLSYGADDLMYDLTSIIVHHGNGFACGHYTSYCWNNEAESWVHCNDSRLSRCTSEDVLSAQPYVLFYARRNGRSPVLNRNTIEEHMNTHKRTRTDSLNSVLVKKKLKN